VATARHNWGKIGACLLISMTSVTACLVPNPASKAGPESPSVSKVADTPNKDGRFVLQFIDEGEAWLASGKKVWRTTQGGRSWEAVYSGENSWDITATIESIQFTNAERGWILVSPEGIYQTVDGGRSWLKQPDPFPDGTVYSISFFQNGMQGWSGGVLDRPSSKRNGSGNDSYAAIASTVDGGKTWFRQVIPKTRSILEFYFLDEAHGWALGWPGLFYLNGNRWDEVTFRRGDCASELLFKAIDPNNVVHEPVSIHFVSTQLGWLSFKNGYLARTTNGGKTWCDLVNPRDVWPDPIGLTYFCKLHFTDSHHGWGLDARGSLHKTDDGGATWRTVDGALEFDDIYFLDAGRGWAVGRVGLYWIGS
jgi:photosystem II stability/assembly factor-like uncharacterized protein